MATPNITREIFDGNLERSTQVGITNRRVVLIGTASDGPMYTPVRVASPGDAEEVFGSISDGTLVRGIKECLDAQAGSSAAPFVAGMRVGGLFAQRSSATVQDDTGVDCLYLEAVDEGTVYNDIHIRFQADVERVFVYNPKTSLYTTWSYNFEQTGPDADLRSLDDLADAINGDASLSQIMYSAVYDNLVHAQFTIDQATGDMGAGNFFESEAAGESVFNFEHVADADLDTATELFNGGGANITTVGSGAGAGLSSYFRDVPAGNLYSIYSAESFRTSDGDLQVVIENGQLFDENNAPPGSVKSLLNITGDASGNKAGVVADSDESQAYLKVDDKECEAQVNGGIWGATVLLDTPGSDTVKIRYKATYGIDDSGAAGAAITAYTADDVNAGNIAVSPDEMEHNVDDEKLVLALDYDVDSAGSYSSGLAFSTFDWVWNETEEQGYVEITFDVSGGSFTAAEILAFKITFNSGPIVMSKRGSVTGLSEPFHYYPQGNTVIFGGVFDDVMAFRVSQINYYQEGVSYDVIKNSPLKLRIYENFGEGGDALINYTVEPAVLGIEMRYYGDVSDLDGFTYLTNGSNGSNLSNAELYDELDECYNHLVSDFFDIIVLMGCSWDSKKTAPNSAGVLTEMAAGFHQQLSSFLNAFNGEMIGVMGFEPLIGKGVGGRILRSDIADRVDDITGSTGWAYANIASFHQPWMYAIDIEGIFAAQGIKYGANVAAATAGLIAGMPVEEAIYRFVIPGVQGMVYRYAEVDRASGKTQIDRLSDARVATGSVEPGGVRVTESRTMSRAGGDFENLMTILALQQVLDICRNVAKGYMGKVTSDALLSALQSELNSGIGEALVPKALRGFKAPVAMTPGERVVGKLTIPLTLSPQFELRDVHYTVTLTADEV